MTYINEEISEEDVEKYAIEAIDDKYIVGGNCSRQWTIDRERGSYLRIVAQGHEDLANLTTWTFLWQGELLELEVEILETTSLGGGAVHGHKRLRQLELPVHMEAQRDEVIRALKEAFTAYKDGGVYAIATSYSLTLDV